MRTWRVGTFSMGIALIGFGICLLISNISKIDLTSVLSGWWPAIFIILGMEILLYFILHRKTDPPIKYDLLSMFIVGIIGFVGVVMASLHSIGLLEKVEQFMLTDIRSVDLPVFSESMDDVERIVLETKEPLKIETSAEKKVVAFGTIRTNVNDDSPIFQTADDYIQSEKIGDTLYVTVKDRPFIRNEYGNEMDVTVLVPYDIPLEVDGNYETITLRTRRLMSNWQINQLSKLNVVLSQDSNVTIITEMVDRVNSESISWEIEPYDKDAPSDNDRLMKSASYKSGGGTYHLFVNDVESVEVVEQK